MIELAFRIELTFTVKASFMVVDYIYDSVFYLSHYSEGLLEEDCIIGIKVWSIVAWGICLYKSEMLFYNSVFRNGETKFYFTQVCSAIIIK